MSDPDKNQQLNSAPMPPGESAEPHVSSPTKKDWLHTVARATETVAPLVARQAPKPDEIPADRRGRWATVLAIAGILMAVLQSLVQFFDLLTRPLAPLKGALPYLAAGLLLLAAGAGIYVLLRAHTRRQRMVAAVSTLAVLAAAGVWGGSSAYEAWRPPAGYRILISEFGNHQAPEYRDFANRIAENLHSQLDGTGLPIEIKLTSAVYQDAATARAEGARQKAGIVIWGWYDPHGVSPHVEVLGLPGTSGSNPSIPLGFTPVGTAGGPGSSPAALEPVLNKLALVTRTPLTLPSLDLFTRYGADQMTYVASAVLAMSYLANDDLEQALALFNQALASVEGDPADAQGKEVVYYQRASVNYRLARYKEARADLEQALRLQPDYAPAQLLLAVVMADHCTPSRNLDAGLAAAQRAAELLPDDLGARRLLAELSLRSGDQEAALANAEAANRLDPGSVDALFLLASVYDSLGRRDDSRAVRENILSLSKQAVAAQPPAPDLFYQLGDAYLALDRDDEALAAYLQAQAIDPEDLRLHQAKGNVYYWKGEPDAAIKEYSSWAQQAVEDPAPHVLIGMILDQQGQAENAQKQYTRAIQLGACDVAPYLLLGGAQVAAGDYAGAAESYAKALEIEPQNGDVLYAAGSNSLLRGDYATAAEEFTALSERRPELIDAQYYQGVAYDGLGDSAKAQEAYAAAVALGEEAPGKPSPYLAYAYEAVGRIDDAIAVYIRLLDEEESAALHTYLGALYKKKGAFALARNEYQRALKLDPKQALVHEELGNIAYARGDLPEAAAQYEDCLAQEESARVHDYAAQMYLQMGNLPDALRHLQAAQRLDQNNAGLAQRIANTANWLNRLDEALFAADQALRLHPDDPSLYFLQGQIAYKRCDMPAAVAALEQSVALSPTNNLYAGGLAGYLMAQGESLGMQPYLEQLHAAPGSDFVAHWLAGNLLAGSDAAAARGEYSMALAGSSVPAGVAAALHAALGRLDFGARDGAAAHDEFSAALDQAPDYVDALIALGDLALLGSDAVGAEPYYRQAQDILPAYAARYSYDSGAIFAPVLHMRLALVARVSGDEAGEKAALQDAERELSALQEAVPKWPALATAAGLLALIQGDSKGAADAFGRALACDQSFAPAREQAELLVAASSRP